jgi:hypothetical protein
MSYEADELSWASIERVLTELGWPRTRENFIRVLYDQPPETGRPRSSFRPTCGWILRPILPFPP